MRTISKERSRAAEIRSSSPPTGGLHRLRRLGTFADLEIVVYRSGEPRAVTTSARIEPVSPERVDDALELDPPRIVALYRDFLARGDTGYYAYLGGRVVHRSWIRFGPVRERLWRSFGEIRVGAGQGYIHFCETHPEARGRHIYPAVLSRILADHRERCPGGVLIQTTADNQPSRRGIEAAGFRLERHIRLRVLFGFGRQVELPRAPERSSAGTGTA